MIKISNREIVDVLRYSEEEVLLVEKVPDINTPSYKVNYFILNFSTGEKEIVTKDAYLLRKYGSKRKEISKKLGNFVMPGAMILEDRSVLVIYPNGETGLFDPDGNLLRDGLLSYNDKPVSGIAEDGNCFWSVCEGENAVIRYFCDGAKMDIRIGGKNQPTFSSPHFVSSDKDYIYVCCEHSYVRKISKTDFTVTDVNKRYQNLTGYYKFGNFAIITTYDGAYCDKD